MRPDWCFKKESKPRRKVKPVLAWGVLSKSNRLRRYAEGAWGTVKHQCYNDGDRVVVVELRRVYIPMSALPRAMRSVYDLAKKSSKDFRFE